MIKDFASVSPQLGAEVFIAPDAWVIGDVILGNNVSIFFSAVLRGDILPIRVGQMTNIQEHALLHTTHGRSPTLVGEQVTIGHRAIVHGATVGNRCLIGMGSIILDEAIISDDSIVGAGSLVAQGKQFPPRSLIIGSPAKVVRELNDEELKMLITSAEGYVTKGREYLAQRLAS